MRRTRSLVWAVLFGTAAQAAPPPSPYAGFALRVDQARNQLKLAEDNLKLVEVQYANRPEPTPDEALARRFSNGEIQYLLGDYAGAAVLFYDLVSDARFKSGPRYGDALFYLSDSLYQQKNFVGAKMYLRELMRLRTKYQSQALARYLEIAGRRNEFEGIDDYLNQARDASGQLPPDIAYVYAKWIFNREDLPLQDRVNRARPVFEAVAQGGTQFRLPASYFVGVGMVKLRQYEPAIAHFERLVKEPAKDERDLRIIELSHLALGRLLYETGKYDLALDRYQEIQQNSEHFVDALYEIAWTQVRKGAYERAKDATDILLLVAPDSTLAPEAQILQGHLLLKLKRYHEATETYDQVINTYAPVRDEIDALLSVHKDPVRYFDDLLAKNSRNLDVASLLPPVALKWATTQHEVSEAVGIVNDLELGRRGVQESMDLAQRILKALDERALEIFPELQEGYTRADAVDSAVLRVQQQLLDVQEELALEVMGAADKAELERLRKQSTELRGRFEQLPTSQAQVEARKQALQKRVDEVDRLAFKLGYQVQSMFAVVASIQKWVNDTRKERKSTPEEEKAFLEKVQHEIDVLTQLQRDLEAVRASLSDQRALADATVGGEETIRGQYRAVLEKRRALVDRARGRLLGEAAQVVTRAEQVGAQAEGLRPRVARAKVALREQVARRGEKIRAVVLAEQKLLERYNSEASKVSADARQLVGRIAFDSFQRVRQQFYDLVLKADVGVVDVAFTRKQDNTSQIQQLAQQKDRELRSLDGEFEEVLKGVD